MYKIKQELIQSILNYLADRPFKEVCILIQELGKIEKVEEKEADKA